jgi:hypothetical protein
VPGPGLNFMLMCRYGMHRCGESACIVMLHVLMLCREITMTYMLIVKTLY